MEERDKAKAILIFDMPNHCYECPMEHDIACTVSWKEVESLDRPEWCPLKPLPKREPEHFTSNGEEVHDVYFQGWNDCLDEITGGRK